MLATNVTPLAFTAWRSAGASSQGLPASRAPSTLLAASASSVVSREAALIAARTSAGLAVFRRRLVVG